MKMWAATKQILLCGLALLVLAACDGALPTGNTGSIGGNSGTGGGVSVQYPTMPRNLEQAQVVNVVDGDTLDVSLKGQKIRLRLIGINTPETVDPRVPVECYGREASNRAKAILSNQTVYLESDSSQDNYDKYGRALRYVWFTDGRLFNLQMIAEGFANEYTYSAPYKYQSQFKAAEKAAAAKKIGLWSPQTCNGNTNQPAR